MEFQDCPHVRQLPRVQVSNLSLVRLKHFQFLQRSWNLGRVLSRLGGFISPRYLSCGSPTLNARGVILLLFELSSWKNHFSYLKFVELRMNWSKELGGRRKQLVELHVPNLNSCSRVWSCYLIVYSSILLSLPHWQWLYYRLSSFYLRSFWLLLDFGLRFCFSVFQHRWPWRVCISTGLLEPFSFKNRRFWCFMLLCAFSLSVWFLRP